jgi:hypothetical protein
MRAPMPQSSGFWLARFLHGAAFSASGRTSPVLFALARRHPQGRTARLTLRKQSSVGPVAEAHRDRMSGPGRHQPTAVRAKSGHSGVDQRPDQRRPRRHVPVVGDAPLGVDGLKLIRREPKILPNQTRPRNLSLEPEPRKTRVRLRSPSHTRQFGCLSHEQNFAPPPSVT